jgi:hypothetical protein
MSVLSWLGVHLTNRGKALSLYKRGMTRARKRDHQGAINDYTASIKVHDLPTDVKAMVLYNRALVYMAAGDDLKGVDDLDTVVAMNEAPVNVKTMARQKLAKMESRSGKSKV